MLLRAFERQQVGYGLSRLLAFYANEPHDLAAVGASDGREVNPVQGPWGAKDGAYLNLTSTWWVLPHAGHSKVRRSWS